MAESLFREVHFCLTLSWKEKKFSGEKKENFKQVWFISALDKLFSHE